jgi:hypothetical protein
LGALFSLLREVCPTRARLWMTETEFAGAESSSRCDEDLTLTTQDVTSGCSIDPKNAVLQYPVRGQFEKAGHRNAFRQ